MPALAALAALALAFGPAHAGTLAGVTHPDRVEVGGQTLTLNGMGLREMLFIDIYVGSLYLPARTSDATKALQSDVPKRIVMHFLYKEVTAEQMRETFAEGLAKLPNRQALRARFDTLSGMMATVRSGDVITLDYGPGVGVSVDFNGQSRGTIEGADFMRAIWAIFIGPDPASTKLKKGMLGG